MEMQKWLTTVSFLFAAVLSYSAVASVQAESPVRKTKEDFLKDYPMNGEVDSYLNKVKTRAQTINSLETTNRNAYGTLLRIAYGELGEHLVPNASFYYAKCFEKNGAARALLAADHPKAIRDGLLNARGCTLDAELFGLMQRIMGLPFSRERVVAADVLPGLMAMNSLNPKPASLLKALFQPRTIPMPRTAWRRTIRCSIMNGAMTKAPVSPRPLLWAKSREYPRNCSHS